MWLPALALSAMVGCDPSYSPEEPGPLQAGVARVNIPAPVGIGTVGYGGFDVDSEPSPFAEIYPATHRVHGHPNFEAVALYRADGVELVFLRSDTVGVFQQYRRAVVLELEERLGRPMDNVLVMGATHTHSGPGRVVDGGGVYDLIADRFLPEFYENMVDAAADVVEQAYADLGPARLGHVVSSTTAGHSDRRCEDGEDYTNGDLPVVAVEREGRVEAVLMAYAIHGTVLDIDDLTLSQDVSGAIEAAVEARFDHPVEVLMFNSWGADMSPSNPELDLQAGAVVPSGYDQMDAIGVVMADAVEMALADVSYTDSPSLFAVTRRSPIDRDVLGYADDVFTYDFGGVYCGGTIEADCDVSTIESTLDSTCLPFSEDYPAPMQTELSSGKVGDLWFVTWPGEPGTRLAESVMDRMRGSADVGDVMFLGYSQDYLGYALLEDDWWQGGYEASGALWGPLQGEYLADEAVLTFEKVVRAGGAPWASDPTEPLPIEPFVVAEYTPYTPEVATTAGTVIVDVQATYAAEDVVTFTVGGSDPWLGPPVATLMQDGEPVMEGGRPVDSDGYRFWVDLVVEPTYAEVPVGARSFEWSFSLPVAPVVTAARPALAGVYTLQVEVVVVDGTPLVVESTPFQIL